MADMFAIRNVDDGTKEFITKYAEEHNITIAEALREIILLVQEHISEKPKKKYKSIFEIYEKVKFSSGDPNLSEKIDEIVYGD
ncbi:hypothetical protein KKF81_06920 [Candidatus Micrarchaeota archaeon]|nr:hypothetical protein [Candidatus Micrarchaeota archaeon]MBU1166662.1 hypothetical protein [Candidatus Micrarchaeota archaeon]MBU1886619.1 hypothetical protein [Candidatus Micrarchaeota archaeon]